VTSIEDLDRRYYPGIVDEHELFDRMIRASLRPGMAVLDAGAGRGVRFSYDYKDHVARIAGADVDENVLHNPNLTDAVVADLSNLPYDDGAFDLAFSKFVFEHLDRPIHVFRELRRVLKPGSHLLIHTPNRWHYVTIIAALTPTRFHVWYTSKLGQDERDTFPTRYRANDPKTIRDLAARSGFRVASLDLLETKPGYLTLHPLAYRLGVAYERLVNRFDALSRFRVTLLVDLEAV
jgi:ubiquinone/menaquinone biosynthesis C-methylase UbiE